jgi:anti-anti-sigma regulatory factor
VNTAILRPHPVLSAVEAMNLRDNFTRVLEGAGTDVIVDLTGVRELSAAGLAAVTNLLGQGRRAGIPVRVLMPAEDSAAARIIDQADLGRFLAPGGIWNKLPAEPVKPNTRKNRPGHRHARSLRRRQEVNPMMNLMAVDRRLQFHGR